MAVVAVVAIAAAFMVVAAAAAVFVVAATAAAVVVRLNWLCWVDQIFPFYSP